MGADDVVLAVEWAVAELDREREVGKVARPAGPRPGYLPMSCRTGRVESITDRSQG